MDGTDWAMLVMASIYVLFNIRKIYHSIVNSFVENGAIFTLGWIGFASIFIGGLFVGFLAPQYGWVIQWALILYISGFFVYRLIFGVRD